MRAVRFTLKADETVPMHDDRDALAVCVKECHLRFTRPDGRVQDLQLPAAGYGFLWPQLAFASDGEAVWVSCRRSPALSSEPVRYLSEFEAFVPAREFEQETDAFMDLVLRRLDSMGETELHTLWREVLAERADPAQSAARRLEARLGFDPDEAPVALVERFVGLAPQAGPGAADEIAPVCAGSHPTDMLDEVINLASRPGILGRVSVPIETIVENGGMPPWQRARRLANAVRELLRLGTQPLDDEALAELLQIRSDHLNGLANSLPHAPMGLAVRTGDRAELKLLFRKRNRQRAGSRLPVSSPTISARNRGTAGFQLRMRRRRDRSCSVPLPPSFCARLSPCGPIWATSSCQKRLKTRRSTLGSQRWQSRAIWPTTT
jgi:hypothetical protein